MPQDYEITAIVKDEQWQGDKDLMRTVEMALKDVGQTVKAMGGAKFKGPFNADKWPEQGDTIHGDVDGGKFKFAKSQNGGQSAPAAPSGQGRTDATGRSIERQVAAKVAGDLVGSLHPVGGHDSLSPATRVAFAEEFHFLVDTIHSAIEGSRTPDDSIPFS